ncbi:Epl1p [Malassezia vespertilionis]|uniref:Epl1p n=1 Tax=Malassezia vespertilionis TaxID=2020962 RepID=A0A2N1JDC7_9BASI|nr:Epl1p [Malassezia vespertilionis]
MPKGREDDELALLAASRAVYKKRGADAQLKGKSKQAFTDGSDMVTFDQDESSIPDEQHHDTQKKTVKYTRSESAKQRGKRRSIEMPDVTRALADMEKGNATSARKPTKREIAEHRAKTAGAGWYDMPAFPGAKFSSRKDSRTQSGKSSFTGGDARTATEKEMRRQVTAIRLRNALDPTRFYRGSGGTGAERGLPTHAQLGRVIGGGLEPSTVLSRKERSDNVVGELVRDAKAVSYSKRKFGEAALSSHQLEATQTSEKRPYHIPTPKSLEVLTSKQYNDLYPPNAYSDPITYVRTSHTTEDTVKGAPYFLDEDDQGWLDKHNDKVRKQLESALKNPKNMPANAKDHELARTQAIATLVSQDPEKYLSITEDEFETIMFVFERATTDRHPLLELDFSKVPTVDDLLPELDDNSSAASLARPVLPPYTRDLTASTIDTIGKTVQGKMKLSEQAKKPDAEERWDADDPFKHLSFLKPAGRIVYPWWRLRRQARDGKPIVSGLNFDESNENNPYVCFRRREMKVARKTRKTDTLQLEKLVRLHTELKQAATLTMMVAQREVLKESQVRSARACWQQAYQLMNLKHQWGISSGERGLEDEELMFSIQPDPIAPVPTAATASHNAQLLKKKRKAEEALSTTLKLRRPKTGEPESAHASKSLGQGAPVGDIGSAILEHIHAVQSYIERESLHRQQASAGFEDLTDSAFQPPAAPPSQRAFRPIQSDSQDTHYWSNHPFARLGRQSCFRRRVGRGGRVFLDRRPLAVSAVPASINAWPKPTQNGMPLASFGFDDKPVPLIPSQANHNYAEALRMNKPFMFSSRKRPVQLPTPDIMWDPLQSKESREPLNTEMAGKFGNGPLEHRDGPLTSNPYSDGASTSSDATENTKSSEDSGDGQSTQATDVEQDAMQVDKYEDSRQSVEEQMDRAQKLSERWRYDEDGGRWAGLGLLGLGGMEGDEEAVLDDFDQRFIRYRMSLLDETNLLKLSTDWTYMRQALAAAELHLPPGLTASSNITPKTPVQVAQQKPSADAIVKASGEEEAETQNVAISK